MTEEDPEMYWVGAVGGWDDFGQPIGDTFYDGKTRAGPWAIMAPSSWKLHCGVVGLGKAQKYQKRYDGRWVKVEG